MTPARVLRVVVVVICLYGAFTVDIQPMAGLGIHIDGPKPHLYASNENTDECSKASCNQACGRNYPEAGCFCDDMCLYYGDCCYDYEAFCEGRTSEKDDGSGDVELFDVARRLQSRVRGVNTLICLEYKTRFNISAFLWTQTRCPEGAIDDMNKYVTKCEDLDYKHGYDIHGTTPVLIDEILYRNFYCAYCNGKSMQSESIRAVGIVNTDFLCEENIQEALVLSAKFGKEAFYDYLTKTCTTVSSSDVLSMERNQHSGCNIDSVIKTCDYTLRSTLADFSYNEKACFVYGSIVKALGNGAIYKNPNCARCNGETEYECHQIRYPKIPHETHLPVFAHTVLPYVTDRDSASSVTSYFLVDSKKLCIGGSKYDLSAEDCFIPECPDGNVFLQDYCIGYNQTTNQTFKYENVFTLTVIYQNPLQRNTSVLRNLDNAILTQVLSPYQVVDYSIETHHGVSVSEDTVHLVDVLDAIKSTGRRGQKPITLSIEIMRLELAGVVDHAWFLNRFWVPDVNSLLLGKMPERATLMTLYFLDTDLTVSSMKCDDNSVRVEEWDIKRIQAPNENHFLGEDTRPQIQVSRTSLIYPSFSTPTGIRFQTNRQTAENYHTFVALVCEPPILFCHHVLLSSEQFVVKNDTLCVADNSWPKMCAEPDQFLLLLGGDALVCSSLLTVGEENTGNFIEDILTLVGNVVSLTCLVITLCCFVIIKPLQTLNGKLLMNLSLALALAQLLFQLKHHLESHSIACGIVSCISHYIWLAVFSWMNVAVINGCHIFTNGMDDQTNPGILTAYLAYGWLAPLVPVALCLSLEYCTDLPVAYHSADACWLGNGTTLLFALGLPVALVVLTNNIMYVLYLFRMMRSAGVLKLAGYGGDVTVYIVLTLIMGFAWLFWFLSKISVLWFMTYPFIALNTLQGVFIFFSFICTRRVVHM